MTTLNDFKSNTLVKTFNHYNAEAIKIIPFGKPYFRVKGNIVRHVRKFPDYITIHAIYNKDVSETYVITDIKGLCERFDVIDYSLGDLHNNEGKLHNYSVIIRNWNYEEFIKYIHVSDYSEEQYKENGRVYKRFLVDKIL